MGPGDGDASSRRVRTLASLGGVGLVALVAVVTWAQSPYSETWWEGLGGPRRGFGVVSPHFQPPDASVWGRDASAPYPTGAYWLNAALGPLPVPAVPYQVAVLPQGFQISYSARRRVATAEAQVDPFGVDWFGLPLRDCEAAAAAADASAALVEAQEASIGGGYIAAGDALVGQGDLLNYTLERRSHLGATAAYLGGGVGAVLCKGSPLVAVEVLPTFGVFLAPGGAAGGRVASLAKEGPGLWNATLTDGSSWAVAALGDGCDVAKVTKGVAVTAGSGRCVARIGFLHDDADWETVAAAAATYATGGRPAFDPERPGRYELRWDAVGRGPLYMLGAPHHVASAAEGTDVLGASGLVGAKGPLAWIRGETWAFEEALPDVSLHLRGGASSPALDAEDAAAVVKQARRDVNRLGASPSAPAKPGGYGELYFEAKELGRLGRLAVVCGDAGDADCRDVALRNLESRFRAWLQRGDTVAVDPTWGGVVSRAGYPVKSGVAGATGQPFANYGNALYSDHHFQFGYFAYAAAVLVAHGRSKFVDEWRSRVFELVHDFANPPDEFGGGDARFPRHGRHKDWYDGHSLATGLVAYATGKSQESSSESAHAYLAVALLGDATGDRGLRDWGRLCLATEVRGAKTYWQMGDDSAVYADAFKKNRMAGSVAGTAAIATTWFGSNPEYVHGINILPVLVGLTDLLFDPAYACDELPTLNAALARQRPYPPVEASWRGFAYADLALVDPDEAWKLASKLDEAKFDDGATKANLLHWIASRRSNRTHARDRECDLTPKSDVDQLPWNASDVDDVTCDGNLACFALGLSGFCCPQQDGYMFGCCPVLKAVPDALA